MPWLRACASKPECASSSDRPTAFVRTSADAAPGLSSARPACMRIVSLRRSGFRGTIAFCRSKDSICILTKRLTLYGFTSIRCGTCATRFSVCTSPSRTTAASRSVRPPFRPSGGKLSRAQEFRCGRVSRHRLTPAAPVVVCGFRFSAPGLQGGAQAYPIDHGRGGAPACPRYRSPALYRRWGKPGLRVQLIDVRTHRLEMDFVVEGDEHSFHVLNAVSPAFTCSMPFAQHVCQQIREKLR